jgi:hypothetical protein
MAVSALMYRSESWIPNKRKFTRIQASAMKFPRYIKGCRKICNVTNEDTRNESGIFNINRKCKKIEVTCKNMYTGCQQEEFQSKF